MRENLRFVKETERLKVSDFQEPRYRIRFSKPRTSSPSERRCNDNSVNIQSETVVETYSSSECWHVIHIVRRLAGEGSGYDVPLGSRIWRSTSSQAKIRSLSREQSPVSPVGDLSVTTEQSISHPLIRSAMGSGDRNWSAAGEPVLPDVERDSDGQVRVQRNLGKCLDSQNLILTWAS